MTSQLLSHWCVEHVQWKLGGFAGVTRGFFTDRPGGCNSTLTEGLLVDAAGGLVASGRLKAPDGKSLKVLLGPEDRELGCEGRSSAEPERLGGQTHAGDLDNSTGRFCTN